MVAHSLSSAWQHLQAWTKEWAELVPQIKSAGGSIATVTSQLDDIDYARAWKMDLSDYPVHHDPANVFASYFDVTTDAKMATQRPGYKEGGEMVQPACMVVDANGNEIYSWRLVPSPENLGGAIDRPVPSEVWARVKAVLAGTDEASLPAVSIDKQEETVKALAAKMPPMAKALQAVGRLPAKL
eukprot:COSAG02_NODE_2639_length_8352_cov_5.696959_4_plen_184_part_00